MIGHLREQIDVDVGDAFVRTYINISVRDVTVDVLKSNAATGDGGQGKRIQITFIRMRGEFLVLLVERTSESNLLHAYVQRSSYLFVFSAPFSCG
jgi:hypothetical protein